MKSIEQRIYENLMNDQEILESMNFNQSVSSNIADAITGINFDYEGILINQAEGTELPIKILMHMNEDDLETVESFNVVYVYLKANNLNYDIKSINPDDNECSINLPTSWSVINPKCWKDNDSLYLLKMNRNTGIISLYDKNTNTFRRRMDNCNYLNTLDVDIARNLLTVDYLKDYISSQLKVLLVNEENESELGDD